MKTIKLLIIIICIAVILTSFGCSTQEADVKQDVRVSVDYPHYSSIGILAEKADLVIEGTIIDSRVEEIDTRIRTNIENEQLNPGGEIPSSKHIYTVYTIKISNSYKGNVKPGDTIEVKQIGGETETIVYTVEGSVKLASNEKYVMFLSTCENTPPSFLNSTQSSYFITDSTIKKEFVSTNLDNELILTNQDLIKIKKKYKKE